MCQCICIRISAMYLASALPGPAQALPGPTHQALSRPHQAPPGPTRPYALPGRRRRRRTTLDHTLDHILFWQPPKTPPKRHAFFWSLLKKQKHTFYSVKYMFSLKWQKTSKNCIKIFSSDSWPSKKHTFYSVKCMFLTLGLQTWNFNPKLNVFGILGLQNIANT